MPRLKTLLYNTAFFLICLLAFFLVFESQLVVPAWLQVGGRMHPLLLHFPITILVLYGLWVLFAPRVQQNSVVQTYADGLLLLGAFTATFTALLGLLLSQEPGYDADAIFWHKWTGVATAFVSFGWYAFRDWLAGYRLASKAVAASTLGVMLFAGHLGANITHGEEFLLAPVTSDAPQQLVAMDDALVYAHVVEPILEEKCFSCHNPQKAKGELIMTTQQMLVKGGKNGAIWDTTRADLGAMIARAHLPLDDKKHMPPRGKSQLTDDEIVVLESWIRGGSSFTARVVEFPADGSLFRFASERLGVSEGEASYEFAAADEGKIRELNNDYRVITPLAAGSPALSVSFFSTAAFKSSDLTDLIPIKDQIVELDASKMPVKDEDLKIISQFPNLHKLLLNFTDLTGGTLGELNQLPHLRYLSLTGTPVKAAQLRILKKAPALNTLYAWSTAVTPEEITKLRQEMKGVALISGFRSDTIMLPLTPPVVVNKEQILAGGAVIKMKHQIKGTVIRYTLDGSEPDSAASPVYKDGVKISGNSTLKARAFKPGWYGSEVMNRPFYLSAFRPDSVTLLSKPAARYNGKQGMVLADGEKSSREHGNGKWVGFQEEPMVALLSYRKPVTVQKVSLSMLQNVGPSIFPPARIEVWGGMASDELKLLGTRKPLMPGKGDPGSEDKLYDFEIPATQLKYLKIVAVPLAKLPAWHERPGTRAWVFMDEVLVN